MPQRPAPISCGYCAPLSACRDCGPVFHHPPIPGWRILLPV